MLVPYAAAVGGIVTLHPNLPTPEGRELGAHLVRLVEPDIAKLVEQGVADLRCTTCAFRAGTMPNGCPTTVMDALKCAMEGVPFYCHERKLPNGERDFCAGWYAWRESSGWTKVKAFWPWSDEEGAA